MLKNRKNLKNKVIKFTLTRKTLFNYKIILKQTCEKKDLHLPLKAEQLTKVNGLLIIEMVMALKLGQMVLNTKETGRKTKHAGKANFGTLMVTNIQEIGRMTKQTDLGFISILMGLDMKANGKMTCNTEKG